jgi:4-hydroxy-tetrahydrodipicolinate synthase
VANIAPRLSAEFQEAMLAGDYCRALGLQDKLMPLHRACFAEPNPCPTKFALSVLGRCEDEVRSPLVPVEERTREQMRAAMRHAGLIN